MTFEILEKDFLVLRNHAWLATESGSIDASNHRKFELERRYIISQIPNLYEYFILDGGRYLVSHGERTYQSNSSKSIFKLKLSSEIAEKYYQIQHRFDRSWVLNALLNIYDHRQEVIEFRENSELSGEFHNYKYPFNPNDWRYSYLVCPNRGEYKGYQINVNEPMIDTVTKYLRLKEIDD